MKETSSLRVIGLCAGNSQRASNAENVSIWWRHHDNYLFQETWLHLNIRGLHQLIDWTLHRSLGFSVHCVLKSLHAGKQMILVMPHFGKWSLSKNNMKVYMIHLIIRLSFWWTFLANKIAFLQYKKRTGIWCLGWVKEGYFLRQLALGLRSLVIENWPSRRQLITSAGRCIRARVLDLGVISPLRADQQCLSGPQFISHKRAVREIYIHVFQEKLPLLSDAVDLQLASHLLPQV